MHGPPPRPPLSAVRCGGRAGAFCKERLGAPARAPQNPGVPRPAERPSLASSGGRCARKARRPIPTLCLAPAQQGRHVPAPPPAQKCQRQQRPLHFKEPPAVGGVWSSQPWAPWVQRTKAYHREAQTCVDPANTDSVGRGSYSRCALAPMAPARSGQRAGRTGQLVSRRGAQSHETYIA